MQTANSSVTSKTNKINYQFECNEKCLVYSLACKKCLKQMLDKPLILFDIVEIIKKVTTKNFNALGHVCENTCFSIFQVLNTMEWLPQ